MRFQPILFTPKARFFSFIGFTLFVALSVFLPSVHSSVYAESTNARFVSSTRSQFFGIDASYHTRSRGGADPINACSGISATYDCNQATEDNCNDLNFRCVCAVQLEPNGLCTQRFTAGLKKHIQPLNKEQRVTPTCSSDACPKENTAVERADSYPVDEGDSVAVHSEMVSNRRQTRASGQERPWSKALRETPQKRRNFHEKKARSRSGSPPQGPDGWVWPSEQLPEIGNFGSCEQYVTHKYDSYLQWEEKIKEAGRDPRTIYELAHTAQWESKIRGPVQSLIGEAMVPAAKFGASSEFTPINFNQVNEGDQEPANMFFALSPHTIAENKNGKHASYLGYEYPPIEPNWTDPNNQPLQPVHFDIPVLKQRDWAQTPKLVYSWNKHIELNNQLKASYTDEELEIRYRKQMQLQDQVHLRNELLNNFYRSTLYCFIGLGWRNSPNELAQQARQAETEANTKSSEFEAEKKLMFTTLKERLLHEHTTWLENAKKNVQKMEHERQHVRCFLCGKKKRRAKEAEAQERLDNAKQDLTNAETALPKVQALTSLDDLLEKFSKERQNLSVKYKELERDVPKLVEQSQQKIKVAESKYDVQEDDKKRFCKELGYPQLMTRSNHTPSEQATWRLASLAPSFLGHKYIPPAGKPMERVAENAPPISPSDLTPENLQIMTNVRLLTVRKLRAFDQQIVELFKHGVELGCFTTELSACNWSPNRFVEWVKNYRKQLIAAREQDFKRCQKLTTFEKSEAGIGGKEKWTFRKRHRDVAFKGNRRWFEIAASLPTLENYFTEVEDYEAALNQAAKAAAKHLRAINPETHVRTLGHESVRDSYSGNDRFGAGFYLGGGWKVWNYEDNSCFTKMSAGSDFNVYAKLFGRRVDFIDAGGKISLDRDKTHIEVRLDVFNMDLTSIGGLMKVLAELPNKIREIVFAEAKQRGIDLLKQDMVEYGTDPKRVLKDVAATFAKNVLKETMRALMLKSIVNPPIDEQIPLNFHIIKDHSTSVQLLQIGMQFFIGPLPVVLKAGAGAGFGLHFDYDSHVKHEPNQDMCARLEKPSELRVNIAPNTHAEAFIALAAGIKNIAEIGIKGTVKLIGVKLPLVGSVAVKKVQETNLPGHYVASHTGLNLELDGLGGHFSVYLKLLLLKFEKNLFSWSGWFTSTNLAYTGSETNLAACKQAVDMF